MYSISGPRRAATVALLPGPTPRVRPWPLLTACDRPATRSESDKIPIYFRFLEFRSAGLEPEGERAELSSGFTRKLRLLPLPARQPLQPVTRFFGFLFHVRGRMGTPRWRNRTAEWVAFYGAIGSAASLRFVSTRSLRSTRRYRSTRRRSPIAFPLRALASPRTTPPILDAFDPWPGERMVPLGRFGIRRVSRSERRAVAGRAPPFTPPRVERDLVLKRTDSGVGVPYRWWNPVSIQSDVPIHFSTPLQSARKC